MVRHAPPRVESGRRRPACVVRCICGEETVAFERYLKNGDTTGCAYAECRSPWESLSVVTSLSTDAVVRHVRRLRDERMGCGEEVSDG